MSLADDRKRTSVTFVSDEDVVQHIVPLNNKIAVDNRKQQSKKKSERLYVKDLKEDHGRSDDDQDSDTLNNHPRELEAGNENFSGKEVFQFQTPKKSGQMSVKANSVATPRSELRTPSSRTPCTKSERKTPSGKAAISPGAIKPRTSAVDDDESSDESLESSDDDGNEDPGENRPASNTPKQRKALDFDNATNAEQYFDVHSGNTNITSDRTLARLGRAKMDHETLCNKLSTLEVPHVTECNALMDEHRRFYNKWMLYMCNGFNILLHGLGSKHGVLEEFRQTKLKDFTHIVVNGYFPSLTIKQILNCITDDIIGYSGSFRTPADQVNFIKNQFSEQDYCDIYVIIHNIDGLMLRAEKTQSLLSHLSQARGLHFIASVDHINSPLIWDKTKCSRFNWLWHDATTYCPYTAETSYENSLLVQQTGALALSSLTHVMRSLTPNARGIFTLLAKYQLDHKDTTSYNGMCFQELYQRCRESFLVNSDLTLRTQLTEFRDHRLIRSKKGYDGTEYLTIPIEEATLVMFLDSQEES